MQMNRTRVQTATREPETPEQIFARTSAREVQLSRLLMFFISGGLLFMLLPGTFLGVWNLISISGRRAAESISPAWIQAHGHAQVLGWIGSFILGIGFYSIPKLRGGLKPFGLWSAWLSGAMWMGGVLLRWLANVYLWQWRVLLPASAGLELAAFLIFFHAVSQHKSRKSRTAAKNGWIPGFSSSSPGPWDCSLLCCSILAACSWLAMRGEFASFSASLRSALSGARGLGIHGAIRMGLQRQVAADFSRDATARQPAVGIGGRGPRDCHRFRTRGFLSCDDRLDRAFCLTRHCVRFAFSPSREKAAKTKGIHGSFPFFVRSRLCLADGSRVARRLGCKRCKPRRHLGCIASRLDRGIHSHDGLLRWSTGLACVFWHAAAVQPQDYVHRASPAIGWDARCGSAARSSPTRRLLQWHGPGCLIPAILELGAVTLFAANLITTFLQPPVAQQSCRP